MKGYILDYTVQTNSGIISGDDNQRYNFRGADWKEAALPRRGMRVDFVAVGDAATEIYGGAAFASANIKIAAGLLAIFLGWASTSFISATRGRASFCCFAAPLGGLLPLAFCLS